MPPIDYDAARCLLNEQFADLEARVLRGERPSIARSLKAHFDRVFLSRTQAYREVLVGCVVARLEDNTIEIHKPYVSQGPDAYNGRTLDERVVNPFLQEKRIPSSRGPFLSTFRRSVTFGEATRDGLRDKKGFDALLALINHVAEETHKTKSIRFLRYLLFRLLELRSQADIALSRLQRMSLEQYDTLITGLLSTRSGGWFPVMLVQATFIALRDYFDLAWEIQCQGINVADARSGAAGDITIRAAGEVVLAAEITERPIDKNRVVATFETKIAPQGIEDYLFFVKTPGCDTKAIEQARQYFSQGHEVNFVQIKNWILMVLATLGKKGRAAFNRALIDTLSVSEIPATLKVAWNDQIARITAT